MSLPLYITQYFICISQIYHLNGTSKGYKLPSSSVGASVVGDACVAEIRAYMRYSIDYQRVHFRYVSSTYNFT